MTNRSKSRRSPVKVSSYSGKVVNGSDVILCTEALEYVAKLGYFVIKTDLTAIIKFLRSQGYDVIDTLTIFD